jgi:hypothetical protein
MKPRLKSILALAAVLALFYIAAFYYLDLKSDLVISRPCLKKGDDFILLFKRPKLDKPKFWILNLRPGQILIKTDQRVTDIEIETYKGNIVKPEKVTNQLFAKRIKTNLIISSIKLIPYDSSINKINIIVQRKPSISIPFVFYQFLFVFILFFICSLTIYFLYYLIFKKDSIQNLSSKPLVYSFITLILIIFVYFALNIGKILGHLVPSQPFNLILFNAAMAVLMIFLYYVFCLNPKGKKLPLRFPVILSLPIIFYKLPFLLEASGDALLWIINLKDRWTDLYFAESLSLLINRLSFDFINSITLIKAKTVLMYTGKLMGVLFLFSLFVFINSLDTFTYKKKLLLFILLLTFSFNVLLFGFPDFAYYSVPFLIFSLLSAQKFMRSSTKDIRYLAFSAVLVIVGGLFHGSAYFSFPVILLLPVLKYAKNSNTIKISVYIKQYLAIILSSGMITFLFFMLLKILGFNLIFNKAAGGFDGRQFISFIPININFPEAVNFMEVGYFLSRGWIFFISGSFLFLLLLFNRKKTEPLTMPDFLLLLFGISQFLIVLFWGFDLGIQDFDLYIAPTTLLFLFLLKYLVGLKQPNRYDWIYILVFSLFSPIYLLISKVI